MHMPRVKIWRLLNNGVYIVFFSAPETVEEIEIIRNGLKGFILGIKVVQVSLLLVRNRSIWVQQRFVGSAVGSEDPEQKIVNVFSLLISVPSVPDTILDAKEAGEGYFQRVFFFSEVDKLIISPALGFILRRRGLLRQGRSGSVRVTHNSDL